MIRRSLITYSLLLICSCSFGPSPATSPAPNELWVPEKAETLPELPTPSDIPPEFASAAENLTLPQLIDLALKNNEGTNISWLRAKAAAANLGSSKGEFYPNIYAGYEFEKNKSPFSKGENLGENTYGPYAQLSFLIFDFGRREANVQQFREALVAASYAHNAEVQNVIFDVIDSYYRYLRFKALAEAQERTLEETLKNVDYAEQRHEAGLATIADVLQAKTASARAKYARQTTEGLIQSLRRIVATAVGLSPTARFEVAPVDLDALTVTPISDAVEDLIAAAQTRNPALAAARAEAARADAQYHTEWRKRFPSLTANYRPEHKFRSGDSDDGYFTSLAVSIPVFTGGALSYDIERARHERDIAASQMRDAAKVLALAVWNDYFAIKTAEQQIVTSRELLESAQVSFDVASARYREGVGTILDLLTAEAQLQEARSSVVDARTVWLIALAQLIRDTGKLEPASSLVMPPQIGAP